MKGLMKKCAVIVGVCSIMAYAAPEVSFGGYLDADVWGDLTGVYFANSELDLGMSLKFSEKVAAHVYSTVWSANGEHPGSIPAGLAPPDERWLAVVFDGFDITFDTDYGSFAVGDLVYQYGKFNYYLYKRLSMITPESFSRGLSYSISSGMISAQLLAGIADRNSSTADVQGMANVTFSESASLGVYVGIQNDAMYEIADGTDFYGGLEFNGAAGEMLSLKFDLGYKKLAGEDGLSAVSVLFEPSLSVGKFSTALSAFYSYDGDDDVVGAAELFNVGDEMFVYVEPGYSFTDMFAAGLPLEYHAFDMANEDDNQFWAVPTFYVYPTDGIEWWLWGQMIAPLTDEEEDLGWGVGSEIIVNF
jgi:hypothetical protein